jgi:hypothetical protein
MNINKEQYEWHNPAGISKETLGGNHRFLVKAEVDGKNHVVPGSRYYSRFDQEWSESHAGWRWDSGSTISVPISHPLPDGTIINPASETVTITRQVLGALDKAREDVENALKREQERTDKLAEENEMCVKIMTEAEAKIKELVEYKDELIYLVDRLGYGSADACQWGEKTLTAKEWADEVYKQANNLEEHGRKCVQTKLDVLISENDGLKKQLKVHQLIGKVEQGTLDRHDAEVKGLRDALKEVKIDALLMKLFIQNSNCYGDCSSGKGGYTWGKPMGGEVPCPRCQVLSSIRV